MVLDKPNKYGACCEPKEGLPAPAPTEVEKCKFPGQVGTPPNCHCPDNENSDFLSFKGCVKFTMQKYCEPSDAGDAAYEAFADKCKSQLKGEMYKDCCIYKVYEK